MKNGTISGWMTRRRKWKPTPTGPYYPRALEKAASPIAAAETYAWSRDTMLLKQSLLLLMTFSLCCCTAPSGGYYYGQKQLFLPALPGETPSCAKHGMTYCEKVDGYPAYRIQYLIDNWKYDFRTLFLSEDEEQYRPRPVYGPPAYDIKRPNFSFAQFQQPSLQPQGYNTIIFNQTQDGYPDRRYPLGDQFFNNSPELYSALLRPDLTANEPWWRRYQTFARKKRQISSVLCPTNSEFIEPKAARNSKGIWKYTVNQETSRQLVRAETCRDKICNGICSIPNGYTSECEQQYVEKKLVTLSEDGETLLLDRFWLPHCCLCKIKPNFRFKKHK